MQKMRQQKDLPDFVLIDDDAVDREVIRRALRELGAENSIIEAEDGEEALQKLERALEKGVDKPRVVILDLNMPRMNGFEFLERIRADERFRRLPVFVLTTSNSRTDKEKAYDRSISGYIVKSRGILDAIKMIDQYQKVIEFPR